MPEKNPTANIVGYLVRCPHCEGENEIYEHDLGDPDFDCQYIFCGLAFSIPEKPPL